MNHRWRAAENQHRHRDGTRHRVGRSELCTVRHYSVFANMPGKTSATASDSNLPGTNGIRLAGSSDYLPTVNA